VRATRTTACIALLISLALCASAQTSPPVATVVGKDASGHDVFKVGGGVSAPRAINRPNPNYSKEARKAKHQGTCVLSLVVGTDGKPHDIHVVRMLGLGLDEEAIKAVKRWTFEPARKDGQPVPVQVNVEVSFRLY
jgi:periplasmic protein TonB